MTPSGYEYTVYEDKAGEAAKPGDYIYYFMDIMNDKDSLIQTSRKNPQQPITTIPLDEDQAARRNPIMDVMKGLSVGDSVGLFLPKDSIPNLPPQFSNVEFIEYRLVIQEIIDEATFKERMDKEQAAAQEIAKALKEREPEVASITKKAITQYNNGELDGQLTTVEGDLKFYVVEQGDGPLAVNGSVAMVQYYGCTMDGEEFDNSFKRGRGFPLNVGAGGVIQGWDRTFPMLNEGSKVVVFIPSALAYAEMGSPPNIGPNEDLAFYIEVENVQ
jgi:FKBP-type peptidyl-prolyl cis-trans isomerase